MATSGSKTTSFCSRKGSNRYYLEMNWTRTSYSESGNYSIIKVQVYLGSYGNGYNMNASATKSGSITVNGTTTNFTKAGISLASGGKIKIFEKSNIQINHNTDGTKTFTMSAYFNPAVTISGSSSGSVTIPSTSFTLNTIPRTSTLSVNASFTAGSNKSVTIKRSSSTFTHDLVLKVGSTTVATRTGIGTSTTIAFTDAELKLVFNALNKNASATASLTCTTKKGSTTIGSVTASGTCTNPTASTSTYQSSVNIGATLSGAISRKNSKFTHRVRLLRTDKATQITQVQASTWTGTSWSVTVPTSIYSLTPNSNNYTMYLGITTYCAGVQTRAETFYGITAKVTGSNPTFAPAGNLNYKDTNTTITAITGSTGNNGYIVQNKSSLYVTLASGGLATAKNSATISKYIAKCAGETITLNSTGGALNFDFGTINASTNQTLTIEAVDSRGNKTVASKTVLVLPYSPPSIVANISRKDGFTVTVPTSVKGTYSRLTVSGTDKNKIKSITHKIARNTGGYGSATSFTVTNSSGSYSTNVYNYTVALTDVAKITVTVTDNLNTTVSQEISISTGLPLFYIDSKMGSASFNKLPIRKSSLELGLKLDLANNQYWGNGNNSYGMHAGNSDIVGVNSIVFNDASNNLGEGLRFPNSNFSTTDGYKAPSDFGAYTNIYWKDNWLYINNVKSFGLTSGSGGSGKYELPCDCFTLSSMTDVGKDYATKTGFRIIEGSVEMRMDANETFVFSGNGTAPGAYSWNTAGWNVYCWKDWNSNFHIRANYDTNGAFFQTPAVYTRTGTSTANVCVSSSGTIWRNTSSAKAKLDIVPAFDNVEDYKKILNIEPVKWYDKNAYESYSAMLTADFNGEEYDNSGGIQTLNRIYGCVAEQLQSVGLDCLVEYDEDNKEIMGVAYDRIPIMYIPLIKDLYKQIEDLKQEIANLK